MTVSHDRIETFHRGSGGLRHGARAEFDGIAEGSGTSCTAAAMSGKLAADTIPGVRSAREALNNLLKPAAACGHGGIHVRVPGH